MWPNPKVRPELPDMTTAKKLPLATRTIHLHARLLVSMAIAVAAALGLSLLTGLRASTAILIGWDVGVLIYLVLSAIMIAEFDLKRVRQRAAAHDEGGMLIPVLTIGAAVASLAAIVYELGSVQGNPNEKLYFGLAVLTCLLSWTFIHLIFALHYAHDYFRERHSSRGMDFPGGKGDDPPDYWDFVYFSFVIGTTFQVSDVAVTSKLVRRVVAVHGVISFLFNVAILALVVNIGAQFIGK
jgi:uncharacterized membrane protein